MALRTSRSSNGFFRVLRYRRTVGSEVRIPVLVPRGVLRHPASLDVGDEERRPVELALFEGAHDLVVVAVERHPQRPGRGLARLPVPRVPAQLVDRRLEPPHLGEGPRAHGVRVVERRGLGHVLPLVLGNDRLLADVGEARGVGPLESELDGRGVHRGHALPGIRHVPWVSRAGNRCMQREREHDVARGERRAVGPRHPRTEHEAQPRVVRVPLVSSWPATARRRRSRGCRG